MRFIFAGDRDISVWVLEYLLARGEKPAALLISGPARASHALQLRRLCTHLPDELVFTGREFREERGLSTLGAIAPDMILAVHFPYIVPPVVLQIPRIGVLNLHPAYLPYNRGWHTASWAIIEGTPVGATLHFMDADVDTGDIVHQKRLAIAPDDTADRLYARIKQLELEVFKEAWPTVTTGTIPRTPQDPSAGFFRVRADLLQPGIQRIDLSEEIQASELLRRLRACTTNDIAEAAYFEEAGKRYRIRIHITEEDM
jgi:methionyl-tRNA formyltransferase